MDTFRKSLHEKLFEMPAPLEEKKKVIRHLVDLEYRGNAVWECLDHQHNWLLDILSHCKDEHTAREFDECELASSNRAMSSKVKKHPAIILTATDSGTLGFKVFMFYE